MNNKNLILIAILVVCLALLALGVYSIFRPTQSTSSQQSSQSSNPANSPSPCQPIVYSSGSKWICGKPSYIACRDLGQVNPSVNISGGDTFVIVVPATESHGVEATGFGSYPFGKLTLG